MCIPGKLRYTWIVAFLGLLFTTEHANAHLSAEEVPFSDIGIPYSWYAQLEADDIMEIGDHVGSWSWDEAGFPATAKGGTYTSRWIKLELFDAMRFKLFIGRATHIPWPSPSNPQRTAGTNLFPFFTLYRGWDTDPGTAIDSHGLTIDQLENFNNRGNIPWAEDVAYMDHGGDSTSRSLERSWTLAAGQYTLNLACDAPATAGKERQGFYALVTTVPVPVLTVTQSGPTSLTFSWPESFSGFKLYQAAGPSLPWTPVDGVPTLSNGQWSHSISPAGSARFYRLQE